MREIEIAFANQELKTAFEELKNGNIEIVSVILEWMNHKDYEKRFKY